MQSKDGRMQVKTPWPCHCHWALPVVLNWRALMESQAALVLVDKVRLVSKMVMPFVIRFWHPLTRTMNAWPDEFTSAHQAKYKVLLATSHQLSCTICDEPLGNLEEVRCFLPSYRIKLTGECAEASHCSIMPHRDMHRSVAFDMSFETIFELAGYKKRFSSQRRDLYLLSHIYPLGWYRTGLLPSHDRCYQWIWCSWGRRSRHFRVGFGTSLDRNPDTSPNSRKEQTKT